MLLLEVPDRAVMEFMGSNSSMAKRYQHVTAVLRGNAAKRLNGFLWTGTETRTETDCSQAAGPSVVAWTARGAGTSSPRS